MLKKRFALAVVISVLAAMAVGCGNDEGNSSEPSLPENSVADTTEPETEPETVAETIAETEAETTVPTEEVTTEPAEPETTAVAEETDVMTNGDLIRAINSAFGMAGEVSFEEHLETAKTWDVIDADAELDENAPVTAELLISAAMRATGFVDGTASLDEILECAVSRGVIESADISAVDVTKAGEIVEKACDAWLNPDFDTNVSVELVEGVVDLTGVIPAEEISYSDGGVTFPAEYADGLETGTVVILPDDTIDGTAYKITAIVITADNVAEVGITPASIEEVYSSIKSE